MNLQSKKIPSHKVYSMFERELEEMGITAPPRAAVFDPGDPECQSWLGHHLRNLGAILEGAVRRDHAEEHAAVWRFQNDSPQFAAAVKEFSETGSDEAFHEAAALAHIERARRNEEINARLNTPEARAADRAQRLAAAKAKLEKLRARVAMRAAKGKRGPDRRAFALVENEIARLEERPLPHPRLDTVRADHA